MNEVKSLESVVSSENIEVNSSIVRSSILSAVTHKQTIQDAVDLHSMPEVISYETLETTDDTSESLKSTEEICNADECFVFKSIQKPRIHQAYYSEQWMGFGYEPEKEKYLRMIKQVKIAPVLRIVDSLCTSSINLQYYGLDSKQFKPLAEVLMNNTTVTELNLKGNELSVDALYHLGQMLRKNKTIRKLNLQHCKIGPDGAEMLGNGLEICENLNDLDLSYNNLGDEGLEILGIKFGYNISIRSLSLSHNNLSHKSGFFLAETMEENVSIENLDLSWNLIAEEQGLKKFLNTTAEHNEGLLKLNLSWNTLGGDKIANIIKNFISQHRTLRELDLSHNKFETVSDNTKIAKGINLAESLKELNLSYNGITADTAFAMLSAINGNKAKLKTLRLDNVWVKPEFHKLSQELLSQNGMNVIVQGVIGGVDIKGPDMQTLLLKRAHFLGYKPKSKKNKKDFGWFLLRLQNSGTLAPVKKAKFEKLIIEDNIKFDNGMIDEFAKRFRNENKKVDLNKMLDKYLLLFPDTALPKPKEKKKPKTPKDGKLSPKGDKLSLTSKKSGKISLRSSLPKLTEEESTIKPSEDVRGSKTMSQMDEKRESYQPQQENIDNAFRASLDVDHSPKQVSSVTGNADELSSHMEDPVLKIVDETENLAKDDAITEHGVPELVEGTKDTETLIETLPTANTSETAVVDENVVPSDVTIQSSADNDVPIQTSADNDVTIQSSPDNDVTIQSSADNDVTIQSSADNENKQVTDDVSPTVMEDPTS